MTQAWKVDLEGQRIAESWNRTGKSLVIRRENVGMLKNLSFFIIIKHLYEQGKSYSWYSFPSKPLVSLVEVKMFALSFLVMEVSFPKSNYTFPSRGIINKMGEDLRSRSDQIFIPVRAISTNGTNGTRGNF